MNFQQTVLILKKYLKSCLALFFVYLWKNEIISSREFQTLKKLFSADLASVVCPCLLCMNNSTNNFFAVAVMLCKNNSFFQLRTWRTLFTSFTHARKNPFWHPLSGWCNFMGKNCPEVSSFLNVRSLLWKTFCQARTIWGKVFKDGPSEICGRQP